MDKSQAIATVASAVALASLAFATTQLADADRDARYTACMYALQTLDPTAPDMAAWSCSRNANSFSVLRFGRAWDEREY